LIGRRPVATAAQALQHELLRKGLDDISPRPDRRGFRFGPLERWRPNGFSAMALKDLRRVRPYRALRSL